MLVNVGKGESSAAEAGLGRGGGGSEASPRIYASIGFAYCPARPATSERGAADDGKHALSMIEVDISLLEA